MQWQKKKPFASDTLDNFLKKKPSSSMVNIRRHTDYADLIPRRGFNTVATRHNNPKINLIQRPEDIIAAMKSVERFNAATSNGPRKKSSKVQNRLIRSSPTPPRLPSPIKLKCPARKSPKSVKDSRAASSQQFNPNLREFQPEKERKSKKGAELSRARQRIQELEVALSAAKLENLRLSKNGDSQSKLEEKRAYHYVGNDLQDAAERGSPRVPESVWIDDSTLDSIRDGTQTARSARIFTVEDSTRQVEEVKNEAQTRNVGFSGKLHKWMDNLRKITDKNSDTPWNKALAECSKMIGAKYVILYEYNEEMNNYEAIAGNAPMRLALSYELNEGPVGACAKTQTSINILDMRRDDRFKSHMNFCGKIVRAMLCVPVSSPRTSMVRNVLQAVEKIPSSSNSPKFFSSEEQAMCDLFAWIIGGVRDRIRLENSVTSLQSKTTGFFESVKNLLGSQQLQQAALNVVRKTQMLFESSYSLLFRVDKEAKEIVLIAQSSDEPLFIPQGYAKRKPRDGMSHQRVPLSTKSLATTAALTETQINIRDSNRDARFNVQADEYLAASKCQLGAWGTGAVLITPVMDTTNRKEIRGVHIMGRTTTKPFSKNDEKQLKGFLDLMAICINRISQTEEESSGVDQNVMSLKDLINEFPKEKRLPEMKTLMDQVIKLQKIKSDYLQIMDD